MARLSPGSGHAYLDITLLHFIPPSLHKVLQYAEMKGFGIILGMDSNAHSTSFDPDTNKWGKDLDLFIAQYKLNIANCSHDPTSESRGAKTCIDITLSSHLVVSLYNWHFDRSYNGSDRNSICFTADSDVITTFPIRHFVGNDEYRRSNLVAVALVISFLFFNPADPRGIT